MYTEHLSFDGALHQHRAPCPAVQNPTAQPCGSFALHAGRAMTLQPLRGAMLRITQGRAWITLSSQPGDYFLRTGDSLRVRANDRMVMEAWPVPAKSTAASPSLYFDWDPVPMRQAAPLHLAVRGNWAPPAARQPAPSAAVAQALVDLRTALGLATGLAARARSAHSSASAAQGRMASGESMASSGALK